MRVQRFSRDRSREKREFAWKAVLSLVACLAVAASVTYRDMILEEVLEVGEAIRRSYKAPVTRSIDPDRADESPIDPVSLPVSEVSGEAVRVPVEIRVVVVGDIMLGRAVNAGSTKREDFTWPFQGTAALLRDADLTLGNLESPIVPDCRIKEEGPFCADPRSVEGLSWAGFDSLSLANNHAHDFGRQGLDDTILFLTDAGIAPVYDEVVAVWDVGGAQVGVIGLDDVTDPLPLEWATTLVQGTAERVDVLIGLVHWGKEYQSEATERQQELGRALVDAGMDVVIGAHTHWVQPVEEYHGGVIFYSLGNFVFDQMWSHKTREGIIARLSITVDGDDVTTVYEFIPVKIYSYGQPQLIESGE